MKKIKKIVKQVKKIFTPYTRKSSEDNQDRQIQSNEDQAREIGGVAKREKLTLYGEIFSESQTAFVPGRIVFNRMLDLIERGKANAILTWHANRLARNWLDAGRIFELMRQGKLLEIKTPSRTYGNTGDDELSLALEFMMSKKDSDDKSKNVKRGLRGKAIKGYPTGVSPIGFLNDPVNKKGERQLLVDSERFNLVQQVLRKYLKGRYSVPQLLKFAREELHLTTLLRKKQGGALVVLSHLYTMLRNPIYAGFFYGIDENGDTVEYELSKELPRMISRQEYERIQVMLGQHGKPHPYRHESAYNLFMKCGGCGGVMTPDFKFQLICTGCKYKFSYRDRTECPHCKTRIDKMQNPVYLNYVYYYCSKFKKTKRCMQKMGVRQDRLEVKLIDFCVNELVISPALAQWSIDNVAEVHDGELDALLSKQKAQEARAVALKRDLAALVRQEARNDQAVSEYEMDALRQEKEKITSELKALDQQKKGEVNPNWLQEITAKFNVMAEIKDILENGTLEEKKEALAILGSNLKAMAGKVDIINSKDVQLYVDALKQARAQNKGFEPRNIEDTSSENEVFGSVSVALLRR